MLNSLMYKLSYYDFAEEAQLSTGQRGFDRVRQYPIGRMNVKLNYFEEVCLRLCTCAADCFERQAQGCLSCPIVGT